MFKHCLWVLERPIKVHVHECFTIKHFCLRGGVSIFQQAYLEGGEYTVHPKSEMSFPDSTL